ncbi:MAG TPA: FAD-dependent monooxygenase [Candidatus Stackebrandtia excrementipullorum]|nr:FAD-dependent monooxygenase [Candidatus Stackebrandtia excrementipullorum]
MRTVDEHIATGESDRLRVLITGAGVAGRSLAMLLQRKGIHPVLVEKARPDADEGYMLALMPLVDSTFATPPDNRRLPPTQHSTASLHDSRPHRQIRSSLPHGRHARRIRRLPWHQSTGVAGHARPRTGHCRLRRIRHQDRANP